MKFRQRFFLRTEILTILKFVRFEEFVRDVFAPVPVRFGGFENISVILIRPFLQYGWATVLSGNVFV